MQSKNLSFPRSIDFVVLFIAAVLGLAAAMIALAGREGNAALLFDVIAGMVLGFTRPRGAWRWAMALGIPLGIWISRAALLRLPLPRANAGFDWCSPPHAQYPSASAMVVLIFGACFIGVYLGVAVDRVVSLALEWMSSLHWIWLQYVKPVLRGASIALGLAIVAYAALSLAQPLQPYALHDRYCWDEFCFSVQSVRRARSLHYAGRHAQAQGVFYVVSARMETPWWGRFVWGPDAVYVTDYGATDYRYSPQGQRIADLMTHATSGCHTIPGASETETVVFDLPPDVVQPRLLVRDTLGFNGLLGGWRKSLFYIKPAFNLRYD